MNTGSPRLPSALHTFAKLSGLHFIRSVSPLPLTWVLLQPAPKLQHLTGNQLREVGRLGCLLNTHSAWAPAGELRTLFCCVLLASERLLQRGRKAFCCMLCAAGGRYSSVCCMLQRWGRRYSPCCILQGGGILLHVAYCSGGKGILLQVAWCRGGEGIFLHVACCRGAAKAFFCMMHAHPWTWRPRKRKEEAVTMSTLIAQLFKQVLFALFFYF